jgi:hypothetical protein
VENGGVLILPLGQMRKADGAFLKKDMKDFLGLELDNNETIPKCESGIVENKLGKGRVYIVMDEYLAEQNKSKTASIIRNELNKVKWLEFAPGSDWLEYMVQKKGDIYILPVFNHGNVGFPSGNGKKSGPWLGKATLDLSRFEFSDGELAVYKSVYLPSEKLPYKLEKLDSIQVDGKLSFDLEVDKFSEIVLGPKDKVNADYFSRKEKNDK